MSCISFIIPIYSSAQANRSLMDVKKYSFNLELNDTSDVLMAISTIEAISKKESSVFELDVVNKNSNGKGMTVLSALSGGKPIRFEHSNNVLRISLAASVPANTPLSLEIHYRGTPADGLIISKNKFGDRTFFGDNWPNRAHHWLPVIDHPSDKAAVDFTVIAPAHYAVIANGSRVEESLINNKQRLTRWSETVEIPTKVMVIGLARFAIHHNDVVNHIPVETWVFPQNKEAGFAAYNTAPRILDFFYGHIAPYPYSKLANVQSKTMFGGMENAGNIFYYENSVSDQAAASKNESLVAHEIAHQWFGNSASEADWHHVWLSEGFATYFTHLYNEFTYGRDKMAADLQEDRKTILDFYKQQQVPIVFQQLPTNLLSVLNPNSYQKASWVLHMLRDEIGNEAFWKGVRLYYNTYQNSNATTADFIEIMEKTAGRELDDFFSQWLYRPGQPTLSLQWTFDNGSQTLKGTIVQGQPQDIFKVKVEIGIYDEFMNLMGVETIQLSERTSDFSLKTAKKPFKLRLDPHTKLLFEEKLHN